jgi:Protein of unknown function (DUF1761)
MLEEFMDLMPAFSSIHWLAVVIAALAGFPVGALWYGPLFGSAWMTQTGITRERARKANMVRVYGITLVLNLVIATSLAMFIGPGANWQYGLVAGVMAGATFVAAAFGVSYLFEFRTFKLWAINAGFQVVVFGVMGAILGAWR